MPAGYTLTEQDPDYVVIGETRTYSFSRITQAIRHIVAGARFVATNPDPSGPSTEGPLPATGSLAALISSASGVSPYYVGKPNPLMMRTALNTINAHSESTAMIGDSMKTDIVSGLEAGLETILVLTGVTSPDDVDRFTYRPSRIVNSIADLIPELEARRAEAKANARGGGRRRPGPGSADTLRPNAARPSTRCRHPVQRGHPLTVPARTRLGRFARACRPRGRRAVRRRRRGRRRRSLVGAERRRAGRVDLEHAGEPGQLEHPDDARPVATSTRSPSPSARA